MKLHVSRRSFRYLGILASWSLLGLPASASPAQNGSCSPSWIPTFGGLPGTVGSVRAVTGFDDGSGPALYAGGDFGLAGGVATSRVARWDGTTWSALGSGMDSDVFALTVFDDGGGPALYAGGSFTSAGGVSANRIAKWDGSVWTPLGSGTNSTVTTMAVFDDGSGPALFVGGGFTTAGGVSANRIAKWDGSSWTAAGSGIDNHSVLALTVYDDGSGSALYAGGGFTTAGGVTANRVAKWDGATWTALGSGMTATVYCLTVHDDGNGPALVAGGDFTKKIARWDGTSWATPYGELNNRVDALAVFDDGSGPALFAGGQFNASWEPTVVWLAHIAKWSGSSWTALGNGLEGPQNPFMSHEVFALSAFDDGSGTALYAGGYFGAAGDVAAKGIAKWDGSSWEGLGRGLDDPVSSLATFDDGSGPALYAGGSFTTAGGVTVNRISKWNGSSWTALGSGMDQGSVGALTVYDDGSGPALYAGGSFTTAGGVTANRIAKWNGSSWTALGSGMDRGGVGALTVFDDSSGPALYAGGSFTTAGGVTANKVAKWNGSTWSALSSATFLGANPYVGVLTVYDDGGGPALYAGGSFHSAGGETLNNIAKWNGSGWTALGSGTAGSFSDVRDLAVYDDGGGPALYAGGFFTTAGGVTVNRIAKWNGSSWSGVAGGMDDYVVALTVHDDGSGPALYAGGRFTLAGGVPASLIARWNGTSWSALGSGLSDFVVHALMVFDDGQGAELLAGGDFTSCPDSHDSYLARWGCPEIVLDFETEDDFATPLGNGQRIDAEFGRLVRISGAGANAGPATFDTTPGGPNDPPQNDDMLIGHGNVLLLEDDWWGWVESVPGFFDFVTDDPHGGDLIFDFLQPVDPRSLLLADINPPPNLGASVTLTDANGRRRVYDVDPGWTGEYGNAGPHRLDLTTTTTQPGNGTPRFATATEHPGFLQNAVVQIIVHLTGYGSVDELTLRSTTPAHTGEGGDRGALGSRRVGFRTATPP